MKNSITIEGKNYISSRRASEITKYTNDYIGQLCRGGKISAKRIGRLWFVDEESLMAYKREADNHFHSQENTSKIISENKSDSNKISSAVSNTGSEHSTQILSESPISDYKASGSVQTKSQDNEQSMYSVNDIVSLQTTVIPPIKWEIIYSSDDSPLLPNLKEKIDQKSEKNIFDDASEKSLSNKVISDEKNVSRKFILSTFQEKDLFLKGHKNLKPFIATFLIIFILTTGLISINLLNPSWKSTVKDTISQSSGQLEAGVLGAISRVLAIIDGGFEDIMAVFTGNDKGLSVSTYDNYNNYDNGVVIMPRTGPIDESSDKSVANNSIDNSADSIIKDRIRNSFSDTVEIKPDNSGTAGVITPVFRETNGEDFIYVMVPVKQTDDIKEASKL